MPRKSIIWTMSSEDFMWLFYESSSLAEMLRAMGFHGRPGNSFNMLKERIKAEGLGVEQILNRSKAKRALRIRNAPRKTVPTSELFVVGRKRDSKVLKKRLIEEGLLEHKCSKCGNGPTWLGEELTLQLDHINGDSKDNRLENLRFLCPNCHSQTDTYCSRNKSNANKVKQDVYKKNRACKRCSKPICDGSKTGLCHKCYTESTRKVIRPPKDILLEQINVLGYCGTGRLYGVSDNAIRKWLR